MKNVITELIKVANVLDENGLVKYASDVDAICDALLKKANLDRDELSFMEEKRGPSKEEIREIIQLKTSEIKANFDNFEQKHPEDVEKARELYHAVFHAERKKFFEEKGIEDSKEAREAFADWWGFTGTNQDFVEWLDSLTDEEFLDVLNLSKEEIINEANEEGLLEPDWKEEIPHRWSL